MRAFLYFLIVNFLIAKSSSAQNSRLSLDLYVGPTIALASIPSDISASMGVGFRHNITKFLSYGGSFDFGNLQGSQSKGMTLSSNPNKAFTSFTTNYRLYSGNLQMCLTDLLNLRKHFKRINPFIEVGAGIFQADVNSFLADGRDKHFIMNFNYAFAGLVTRYYISPKFDFKCGVNLNYTQSHYLDGIPTDGRDDYFITCVVGISYKPSATHAVPHIEWTNVVLPPRKSKEIPNKNINQNIPFAMDVKDSLLTNNASNGNQSAANKNNQENLIPAINQAVNSEVTQEATKEEIKQISQEDAQKELKVEENSSINQNIAKENIVLTDKQSNTAIKDNHSKTMSQTTVVHTNHLTHLNEMILSEPQARFSLIVGSFKLKENAIRRMNHLVSKGYSPVIIKSLGEPTYYRVCIESSKNKSKFTRSELNRLNKIYNGIWIYDSATKK